MTLLLRFQLQCIRYHSYNQAESSGPRQRNTIPSSQLHPTQCFLINSLPAQMWSLSAHPNSEAAPSTGRVGWDVLYCRLGPALDKMMHRDFKSQNLTNTLFLVQSINCLNILFFSIKKKENTLQLLPPAESYKAPGFEFQPQSCPLAVSFL